MAGIKDVLDGIVTVIDNTIDSVGSNIKNSTDEKEATVKYIDAKTQQIALDAQLKAERERNQQKLLMYAFFLVAAMVFLYSLNKWVLPNMKK